MMNLAKVIQPLNGVEVCDVYLHLPPIASLHWGLLTLSPSDFFVLNKQISNVLSNM